MGKRKRNVMLAARVTEEERELIARRMEQAGVRSLRAYLLKMAVDGYVVNLDLTDVREMVSLLRRNKMRETFESFKNKVSDIFGGIKDAIVNAFRKAKEGVKGFFDWIGRSLSWLNEKIEGIPILGGIYKSFKSGASTIASGAKSAVQWIGDQLSGNALGTGYWKGGLTRVHERGGEILNLPSGTQIIPHDISRRMATGKGIMVQVTIQGNVIGNHAYAEEMGGYLAKKVLAALDNT